MPRPRRGVRRLTVLAKAVVAIIAVGAAVLAVSARPILGVVIASAALLGTVLAVAAWSWRNRPAGTAAVPGTIAAAGSLSSAIFSGHSADAGLPSDGAFYQRHAPGHKSDERDHVSAAAEPEPGDPALRRPSERPLAEPEVRADLARRGRGVTTIAAAVVLVLAAAAVVLVGGNDRVARGPFPTPSPTPEPLRRVVSGAPYEGRLRFDAERGRWNVHETFAVTLPSRLTPPRNLAGGWVDDDAGSRARSRVYVRDHHRAVNASHVPPWPLHIRNDLAVPMLTLTVPAVRRHGRRVKRAYELQLIAADGSLLHLIGPTRLIGETAPALVKRSKLAGNEEVVDIELTGLRHDASLRRVQFDVGNWFVRSMFYGWLKAAGGYVLGLIGLVVTTLAGLYAKHWFDRKHPAPVATTTAPATA